MNAVTAPIQATKKCPYDISWELVTPTRAKLWLKQTRETEFSQRGIAHSAVDKYAHEMATGDWFQESGDSILIATHAGIEVCLNGQHRLTAIIKSDTPLNTLVIRNVPREAFKHVDQGKERTLKDVMDAAKLKNSVDLQTTVKNLWKYSVTGHPLQNPDSDHMISAGAMFDWMLENEPNLESWYDRHSKRVRKAARANKVPAGTLAYLYLRWSREDAAKADAWMAYLEDPIMSRPPCAALALAATFYRDYKTEINATGQGNKTGHWADITLLAHQAYNLAWNMCANKSTIRTMKGFGRALTDLGNELPDLE